jgi:hypothetical protein
MSDNKSKRDELEKIYGSGSMFQKARTEEYIATLPRIKGIKQYIREKHYSGKVLKQLRKQMQFHHMKHVSEGGKTTLENGAVVDAVEHPYMHSLPREHEEIINNHIRKWKVDFMTLTTEGVQESGELVQDDSTETIEIPVHTYHRKVDLRRAEERRRRQEKREFNKLRKEIEDR